MFSWFNLETWITKAVENKSELKVRVVGGRHDQTNLAAWLANSKLTLTFLTDQLENLEKVD